MKSIEVRFSRLVLLEFVWLGNSLWVVFMCYFSSKNIVQAMGDLEHVW
jgi:hypothetical protein